MINLLPNAYRLKAKREYRRRLLMAGLGLGSGVSLIGLGLLVPMYLMVRADEETARRAVAFSEQSLGDPLLVAASADMAQAQALYTAIAEKNTAVRPSEVLGAVMAARPAGLTVRSVTYTIGPKNITITLGGVAHAREQLLQFKNALLAVPQVASVEFPPSNLTASSTVPYSMKIQYAVTSSADR